MPSVPASGFQLVLLFVFVLPGVVFQFARSRLRGPSPDDSNSTSRILRALTVSTALAVAYALMLGRQFQLLLSSVRQGRIDDVRQTALLALLLLFIVPLALAGLDYLLQTHRPKWLKWGLTYDPTPSAWDFAFIDRKPTFLRIQLKDGRYIGGWFGVNSFVSSYPEPHDIFIEQAYEIDEAGVFGPELADSAGIWISCNDVVLVEFLADAAEDVAP